MTAASEQPARTSGGGSRLAFLARRPALADPRFAPRRILIVSPNPLGDAVMAEPAMRAVARRFPDASVDLMMPRPLVGLGQAMPFAARVVGLPFGGGWRARLARLRLLAAQAATRYDLCVLFPNSLASARFARFAGIRRVVGFARNGRERFLTDGVPYLPAINDREHMVGYYGRIAGAFGRWPVPGDRDDIRPFLLGEADTTPTLRPEPDAVRRAAAMTGKGDYVVLAPGAAYGGAKRWPPEHLAALARILAERGRRTVLVGGPGDGVFAARIVAMSGLGSSDLLDLCERTDLATSVALIAGAIGFVGNDSGPAHIAAALDRPGVTLFGSSSIARSGPIGRRMRVLALDLDCAPCFQRECPLGHLGCLTGIEPARVADALDGAMGEAAA